MIKAQLEKYEPAITREAAYLISQLVLKPENMLLWLKFDAARISVASAGDLPLLQWGNPQRLPKDRGIFRNWGTYFDFGDVVEVPGGIKLKDKWSVSVWIVLPVLMGQESIHTLL